jgi:hypothetical protein
MPTDCTATQLFFPGLPSRRVEAGFDGGTISSDAGGLLLREVDSSIRLVKRFAGCFQDHREATRVDHSVTDLVAQRVFGLALGYEDLNDHDDLRRDPLLATLVGKLDPLGRDRRRARDGGFALAGKSTLNRLELAVEGSSGAHRYHRITYDSKAIDDLLVDLFLDSYETPPDRIVLDLDATDDPLHGDQEGRFFHGYYRCYCYLPLYIFCDDHLLCCRLRPSNLDAAAGSQEELDRIVGRIRSRWPKVGILLRGDSGFAREWLMSWCEEHDVAYVLGLARNPRLRRKIAKELKRARRMFDRTGKRSRVYRDFTYRTRKTWSRGRRVVGKAEHLTGKSNPRFVVTSLSKDEIAAALLYEDLYCARGDMENRIKEQQLDLFSDRTSAGTMRANQLRLYFSGMAYVLMTALRRWGLRGTELAKAQCGTIRTKLLKIGALVSVSVRRVLVRMASGYPYADLFERVLQNLREHPPPLPA